MPAIRETFICLELCIYIYIYIFIPIQSTIDCKGTEYGSSQYKGLCTAEQEVALRYLNALGNYLVCLLLKNSSFSFEINLLPLICFPFSKPTLQGVRDGRDTRMGAGREYLSPALPDNKTPLAVSPAEITWFHCPSSQSVRINPDPFVISVAASLGHLLNPGS